MWTVWRAYYTAMWGQATVRAALTAVGEVERQTEPVAESETEKHGDGGRGRWPAGGRGF